ncbi:MAG TPA: ABC transporter permease [Chitinophagaceae bacterium]|jgi:hypothetical protein|nr:ABC transporter permease [Chitinophagaceae bacterium]
MNSFIISTRSELLKSKRSASFWLSIITAAFIPVLFSLALSINASEVVKEFKVDPWNGLLRGGFQAMNSFLFPMYVILICSLIPQIEYKNNTWKQVFAAPNSVGNIFFSKFLTIHFMIFFCFLLFNILILLTGVFLYLVEPQFTFLDHAVPWKELLRLNGKTYLSVLGISAIQYAVSLRFKNFIAPVGIGLALLVLSIIALNFQWKHIAKLPFAHPILTLMNFDKPGRPLIENHEWNSVAYGAAFLLIGFLDLRFKKEKG